MVEEFDAGKTAHDGHPRDTIDVRGMTFANTRCDSPVGTTYGYDQKQWIKEKLKESQAVWKVCVNSIPQTPLSFDFRFAEKSVVPDDIVMSDSWEGYPAERREMLEFLRDNAVTNYISLSGDHHMHFCGLLSPDRDDGGKSAVGAEFVSGGISSSSFGGVLRSFLEAKMPGTDAEALVAGPAIPEGQLPLPWTGVTTLFGWEESLRCLRDAKAGGDARPDPAKRRLKHIPYMDSDSYGICVCAATASSFDVEFLTFDARQEYADYANFAEPIYIAKLSVPSRDAGSPARIDGPTFTGKAPFPFDKPFPNASAG
ncbi:MAG: alkaline phosphatase D family protein [Rhizomicrobium sp.]